MRIFLLIEILLTLLFALFESGWGGLSERVDIEAEDDMMEYLLVTENSISRYATGGHIAVDLDQDGISDFLNIYPTFNQEHNIRPFITLADIYFRDAGKQTNFEDAERIYANFFDLNGDGRKEILVNKLRHDSLFIEILSSSGQKTGRCFFLISGSSRPGYQWECQAKPMEWRCQAGDTSLIFSLHTGYSYQPRGIVRVRYPSGEIVDARWFGASIDNLAFVDIERDGINEYYAGSNTPDNCQGLQVNGTDDRHTYFFIFNSTPGSIFYETLGGLSNGSNAYPISNGDAPIENFWILYSQRNTENADSSFLAIYHYPDRRFLKKVKLTGSILTTAFQYDYDGDGKEDILLTQTNGALEIRNQQLQLLQRRVLNQPVVAQWFLDLDQNGLPEIFIHANRKLYVFSDRLKLLAKQAMDVEDIQLIQSATGRSLFVTSNTSVSHLSLRRNTARAAHYRRVWITAMLSGALLFAGGLLLVRWYKQQQIPYLAHHALQNLEIPGVLILDQQGRLRQMNEKARMLLNLTTGHQGQPFLKIANELIQRMEPFIERAYRQAQKASGEQTLLFMEASANLHVFFRPLRTAGDRFKGLFLTLEDRTEQIQAMQALAWSTMAQRLAHQIKTPLSSVVLAVQRLQMEYVKDGANRSKEYDRYVDYVTGEVGRIRHIVDGLLKLARLEKPVHRACRMNDLVRLALKKFEPYFGAGIKVRLSLEEDLPPVMVDDNQIIMALSIVMENSIEAMPQGGRLTLSTEPAYDLHSLHSSASKNFIRILIADNGTGIDEEAVDKVFEPFYTTKASGTGLGLLIAKKIIEDHGGNIKINNKPKQGAEVTILLPVNHQDKT